MQYARAPGSVLFDEDELRRIERAQVALLLHKTPGEVDSMSAEDIADVLAINGAMDEIRTINARRATKRR